MGLLFLAAFLLMAPSIFAQGKLPSCEGDVTRYWTNCYGVNIFAGTERYAGEWYEGMLQGRGIYTYSNGDQYIGLFKGGVMDGPGTYIYSSGRSVEGIWFLGWGGAKPSNLVFYKCLLPTI